MPTDQRLDRNDPLVAHVHDGLVEHLELATLESHRQIAFEVEQFELLLVHLVVEDLEPALALALRSIHRHVGRLEQCLWAVDHRPWLDDQTDAGGDEHLATAHHYGHPHLFLQPADDADRVVLVDGALQQDSELVTAEASDKVLAAHTCAQAIGDGNQQIVARLMADAVVDDFEIVQVDEQHRYHSVATALDRTGDVFVEQQAIGQTRQRVESGTLLAA